MTYFDDLLCCSNSCYFYVSLIYSILSRRIIHQIYCSRSFHEAQYEGIHKQQMYWMEKHPADIITISLLTRGTKNTDSLECYILIRISALKRSPVNVERGFFRQLKICKGCRIRYAERVIRFYRVWSTWGPFALWFR